MLDLAVHHASRDRIARHYLHLGERQRRTYFGDGKTVALKKVFYALRPAAALRWLRMRPDAIVPPMHFPTLIAESALPATLAETISELLMRKALTHEMGEGTIPKDILTFIDAEFSTANTAFAKSEVPISSAAVVEANRFFRKAVEQYG